jgi:hypothetical protein
MGIEHFMRGSPEKEAERAKIEEARQTLNPELQKARTEAPTGQNNQNEELEKVRDRVNFYRELSKLKEATNFKEKRGEQAYYDKMSALVIKRDSIIQGYKDIFPGLANRLGTTSKADELSASAMEMGVNDVLDEINNTWYKHVPEKERQELAKGEIRI